MPRPTKFDATRTERILQTLRTTGCSLRAAAAAAGISESLLHLWLQRGREAQSGPFRAFFADVQQAIAASEEVLAAKVAAAGDRDWRAAAWLLERRFPDGYAPTLHLQRHLQKLTDDQLQALVEEQLLQLSGALASLPAPDPAPASSGPGGAEPAEEPVLDADFTVEP